MVDLAQPGGTGGGWEPADGLFNWNPDEPPESASSLDDEFTEATLNAKWTIGNPGGNFAVVGAVGGAAGSLDTIRKMLRVTSAAAAGQRWGWVSQPLPAGDLTAFFVTRCLLSALSGNNGTAGLLLGASDLQSAPTTADFYTIERYAVAAGLGIVARRYSSYTTVAATTQNYAGPAAQYLACSLSTVAGVSTIVPYWSNDGVCFYQLGTAGVALPFTASFVGLGADCNVVGNDGIARFDFFRAFTGAGTGTRDAVGIGRQVALPIYP